jgi:serine/threonine protein kinase
MSKRLEELQSALADKYEIERELGHGGMATVYLANDVKHQRQVAVKVLRPDLAAALGPDRFLREIRIAANLTHPHILPLHDSGEAGGFLYYVMPFIKGQTLRDRIDKEGELPIVEAVRIVREVVDALAFAHSEGVVHRDIKPDNVMLTGGHAIVADFGVAKAVSEATGRDKLTTAGVALGTPAYMSPEQATADPHVDHRSDIYAVGAMAYELLAGRTPFVGATPQSILAAHVTERVDPVSKYRDHVSPELDAVLLKCLEKKPADRWQTAGEMLPHLETLATSSGGLTPIGTMPLSAVQSQRKALVPRMAGGAVLLILAGVIGTQVFGEDPIEIVLGNNVQVTFGPEIDFEPDLSDDGSTVAYSSAVGLRSAVMSKSLADVVGGQSIPLASELGGHQRFPRFSNGNLVVFQRVQLASGVGSTFRVSETGGTPREVVNRRSRGADWDPTGERIAFRFNRDSIMIVASGGGERHLLTMVPPPRDAHSFAWSPDGEWIAFVNGNSLFLSSGALGNVASSSIWLANIDGREPIMILPAEDLNVSPAWLPDSRHLLFVSDREGTRDAFVVPVGARGTEGEVQRLGISEPHSIAVSADGSKLAYSQFSFNRNIRSYPLGAVGPVSVADGNMVTIGNQIVEHHGVSADGEWIVYDSNLNGNQDIFKVSVNGGSPIPITNHPADEFAPDLSPDGTEVAYYSLRDGFRRIFVSPANGGEEVQLSPESENQQFQYPVWSPDGLRIRYGNGGGIWIVERDSTGGLWSEPVQFSTFGASMNNWSPDGRAIVFHENNASIWRKTLEGELQLLFQIAADGLEPNDLASISRARLSPDGATIFVDGSDWSDKQGVWSIPYWGGHVCQEEEAAQPVCESGDFPTPNLVVEIDHPGLMMYGTGLSVGADHIYLTISEYESDIYVRDLQWEQ